MKQAVIPGLVAMLGFAVAAGATYAFRLSRVQPVVRDVHSEPTPIQVQPRRTRVRPVRAGCPTGLDGFEPQLAEIHAETARVRAEVRGTRRRVDQMGQAWPIELDLGIEPDTVRDAVAALLPDDALVEWSCEAVPCTGIVALLDDDSRRAEHLVEVIEARFPGSSDGLWAMDAEAHEAQPGQRIEGYALRFQVMPELVDPAHKERAYYLSRYPRKAVTEAMRARLRSVEP